jgi:hypothetical protein
VREQRQQHARLLANATAAIFVPRRSPIARIQRLRGSRLRAAKRSVARAPWISKVRK